MSPALCPDPAMSSQPDACGRAFAAPPFSSLALILAGIVATSAVLGPIQGHEHGFGRGFAPCGVSRDQIVNCSSEGF